MLIYVITSHNRNGYRTCNVFDNKNSALEFIKHENLGPEAVIEECALNEPSSYPSDLLAWVVVIDQEGYIVGKVERMAASKMQGNGIWFPSTARVDLRAINFLVWAQDSTHAIKIANERRAQLLAADQWVTNWDEWGKLSDDNNLLKF